MGEQPGGGGDDSGAEVADRQLPQLPGEHGDAERRQVEPQQGDPVALQHGADRVQPALVGCGEGGGVETDDVAVLLEQDAHVDERGVEGGLVGRVEQGGGGRLLIGGR
ncbi:hypothetical protein RKD30_004504 [Streptomyces pristinaespiralis]